MDFTEITKHMDIEYGCALAKTLSLIGNDNNPMGFRNAGSTGEKKAALFLKEEMEKIGLQAVSLSAFPVDGWEFSGASLSVRREDNRTVTFPLSAFAGTPGTGPKGLQAELVDIGGGTCPECAAAPLSGNLAFAQMNLEDYWLGIAAYQAELFGAKGLIVSFDGDSFGTNPDALNSADCIARPTIPILNISRNHAKMLKKFLTEGPCSVKLTVDAVLNRQSAYSQNVIGMIPGTCSEKYILLGAHYDAYFHSFQDDAFGVGVIMMLAKAIMASNRRPNHTIVVIAHGAEEFGACDNHYDWCIGSWNQISKIRPDWPEKIKIFMNIDAVNPDAKKYLISASPPLHDFLKACFSSHPVPEQIWPEGMEISGINGPWSDDYNYAMAGVPVVICGRGDSAWRRAHYHTQFDNDKILDKDLFGGVFSTYAAILAASDETHQLPLAIKNSLLPLEMSMGHPMLSPYTHYTRQILRGIAWIKKQAREYLDHAEEINKAFSWVAIDDKLQIATEKSDNWAFTVNQLLAKEFTALDFSDSIVFPHEYLLNHLAKLEAALAALREGKCPVALQALSQIDGAFIAANFEKKVYRYWCLDGVDSQHKELNWGNNKMPPQLDIYDLYHGIASKIVMESPDFTSEIVSLQKMCAVERNLLEETLAKQAKMLFAFCAL